MQAKLGKILCCYLLWILKLHCYFATKVALSALSKKYLDSKYHENKSIYRQQHSRHFCAFSSNIQGCSGTRDFPCLGNV